MTLDIRDEAEKISLDRIPSSQFPGLWAEERIALEDKIESLCRKVREEALDEAAERAKHFAGIPMNKRPIRQMTTWGLSNSIATAILSLKSRTERSEKA